MSLDELFRMQKDFGKVCKKGGYPEGQAGRVLALAQAIQQEAAELFNTVPWKWWKNNTPFNRPAAKEELIDILHFVIQCAIELDMTPEDVLKEYRRKNEINRDRQASGH